MGLHLSKRLLKLIQEFSCVSIIVTQPLQIAHAHPLGDNARNAFSYMLARLIEMFSVTRHVVRYHYSDGAVSRSSP